MNDVRIGPPDPAPPQDLGGGTWLLDTGLGGMPRTIGVFLQHLPDGRAALIEAGSGATAQALQAQLQDLGVGPRDLAALIVTHVHLDHAAAAGTLSAWADAPVYVHPSGLRHLHDPAKLWASAARLYGDAMDALWGPMQPVPEARLQALEDGQELTLGGRSYRAVHTPGHARHHLSLLGPDGEAYAGDAAGIQLPGSPLIRPALPPPDVDLEAAEASCRRLADARPARLLLTHFGPVDDPQAHLAAVPERNRAWAEEVRRGLDAGEDEDALIRRMEALEEAEMDEAGLTGPSDTPVRAHLKASSDARMTVMGLVRYWRTRTRD
ncbi:MAG: MBL fold metallo-hydrolase [Trueperaceae bacterium]|nr:MBL fold metallo-hydrolase [Trueperaceae bacterium]